MIRESTMSPQEAARLHKWGTDSTKIKEKSGVIIQILGMSGNDQNLE